MASQRLGCLRPEGAKKHKQVRVKHENFIGKRGFKEELVFYLESYTPIGKYVHMKASQGYWGVKAYHMKKKKKGLVTFVSGPHVHKKSREQYAFDHYRSIIKVSGKTRKGKSTENRDLRYRVGEIFRGNTESIASSVVSCVHSWREEVEIDL